MRAAVLATTVALVAVIAVAALWLSLAPRTAELSPSMVNVEGADIGGPFQLTAQGGERVSSEQLIDGPTLIYFGYTFCPDVCPVDTQIMAEAVDILAEQGIEVTPVFITVDPERDTVEQLAEYAPLFHPRLVALTGSPEATKAAAQAYRVYFAKAGDTDSDAYLMDHSTFIYLMGPDGRYVRHFAHDAAPEEIATAIEAVIAAS
jgi:protein SCO1